MEIPLTYLAADRRRALARGEELADRCDGAALFADISGFTPFTDLLAHELGLRRGADELTRHLNAVYDSLIAEIDRAGGSVVGLSGDAITAWFDCGSNGADDSAARGVACALAMQEAMHTYATITTPSGKAVSLALKVAVEQGPVRRFRVGDPQVQYHDVLAGATLDRLAAAEHLAHAGEVIVGPRATAALGDLLTIADSRDDPDNACCFAHVTAIRRAPSNEEALTPPPLDDAAVRTWLLDPVYSRLRASVDADVFLTELRPAVALFIRFGGLDYDTDDDAGVKLDGYIRWVQRVVGRYAGSLIDITMGDKGSYLYVAFGAPLAHENDSERALRAALDLLAPPPELGWIGHVQIGMSRGIMRAGAYGGSTRQTYGALGDAVNMASRLMMRATPGQIIVSHDLYRTAPGLFRWAAMGEVEVKGKAEPFTIHRLLGFDTRLPEPAPTSAFVGREQERAVLSNAVAAAGGGRGQVIGLRAEAGMGKSRLMAQAIGLAEDADFAVYVGECQSTGTQSSYGVWHTIWRAFFGLSADDSVADQVAWLETQLDPVLLPRMGLLGVVLGLPLPMSDAMARLDARGRKAALEALLTECVQQRARTQPVAFMLDDCHWIDPLSQDLLETIARSVEHLPVLIVVAYRPSEADAPNSLILAALPHFGEIALTEFSAHEAEALIGQMAVRLFGAKTQLPPTLVAQVIARAQGNPFYIEELLNLLRDHGRTVTLDGLELPTSLHSLILSRIDRLNEVEKNTLKMASVVGRVFKAKWLWGAYPALGEERDVQNHLARLAKLDLTPLDTPEPDLTYIFKHGLTREVAYESMAYGTRALLHEQVAAFLEGLPHDPQSISADLLAYHYGQSTNVAKQREYFRKAGDAAQAAFNNLAAISYYRRLLPLLADDPDARLAAMAQLGAVLQMQARNAEALDLYTELRDSAEARGDVRMLARAWVGLADVHSNTGDMAAVIACTERAEILAQESNAPAEVAEVLSYKAWALNMLGRGDEALRISAYGAALAERDNNNALITRFYTMEGYIHRFAGRYHAARQAFAQSVESSRKTGDARGLEGPFVNVAGMAEASGDFETALENYNSALAIARSIEDRIVEIMIHSYAGYVYALAGRYPEAEQEAQQALAMIGERVFLTSVHAYSALALARTGQGNLTDAVTVARTALDIALGQKTPETIGMAWRTLGTVAADAPDVLNDLSDDLLTDKSPAGCFAQSIGVFEQVGMRGQHAQTLLAWAQHDFAHGDAENGVAHWQQARDLFETVGADGYVTRMDKER